MPQNTAASRWCDVYTFIKYIEIKHAQPDPRTGRKPTRPYHGFINLSPLIHHPEMLKDPMKYVFSPTSGKPEIIDIDGFPHLRCKPKYIEAIRNRGDDYKGILHMLKAHFKPEAINLLWPDLVLRAHNMEVRRQNRRELLELHRKLKKIPRKDRQLHAEVAQMLQNTSVSAWLRDHRSLTH